MKRLLSSVTILLTLLATLNVSCKQQPDDEPQVPHVVEFNVVVHRPVVVDIATADGFNSARWCWGVLPAENQDLITAQNIEDMLLNNFQKQNEYDDMGEYLDAKLVYKPEETELKDLSYNYANGNYVVWACGLDKNYKVTEMRSYPFSYDNYAPNNNLNFGYINQMQGSFDFVATEYLFGFYADYHRVGYNNFYAKLSTDQLSQPTLHLELFTPLEVVSPVGEYSVGGDDLWILEGGMNPNPGGEGALVSDVGGSLFSEYLGDSFGGITDGTVIITANDNGTYKIEAAVKIGHYTVDALCTEATLTDYTTQQSVMGIGEQRTYRTHLTDEELLFFRSIMAK